MDSLLSGRGDVRKTLIPNLKFKVRDRRDACPTTFLCLNALYLCAFCTVWWPKRFHILLGKMSLALTFNPLPPGEEITNGALVFSGGGSGLSRHGFCRQRGGNVEAGFQFVKIRGIRVKAFVFSAFFCG